MKQLNNLTFKNTIDTSKIPKEITPDKKSFSEFLTHFNTIHKLDTGFFSYDNRRVDYLYLQGEALKKGITQIPSQSELSDLV